MKFPGWGQANNDGPPDLDQVMRDLSKKINAVFGNQGGNGQGDSPEPKTVNPEPLKLPILPILAILFLIWMATGFYTVDQGSRGVELRFGKVKPETTGPGPHWHLPTPIESEIVVNTKKVQKIEVGYRNNGQGIEGATKKPHEALMLTEDGNIVEVLFAVQYNLKNANDYLFNNRSTDEAVRSAAETSIREVVGKNKLDDILQKGEAVLDGVQSLMQSILDGYASGVNITSVSLQSAKPPVQVFDAFEDVQNANQDRQRLINEGEAYANKVIPSARGKASRLIAESEGYKLKIESEAKGNASRFEQILTQYLHQPEVTKKRLYLDAQEHILSSVSKIIIDQKSGSNLMYLPIDKLMQKGQSQTNQSMVPVPSRSSVGGAVPEFVETAESARDALRSRSRLSR